MKSSIENGVDTKATSTMTGFPMASRDAAYSLLASSSRLLSLPAGISIFGNLWLCRCWLRIFGNILSVHFNVPSIGAVLLYWPLVMIWSRARNPAGGPGE